MFDYERLEALSIEGEAPQSEPERQYYFMKKCRQWAEEEKERIGHPLTMSIQTLGCQMNAKDSEKMTAILEYIGYKEVEEPVADFVLYNTCTVRENANLKIYGRLGYLKNHKKKKRFSCLCTRTSYYLPRSHSCLALSFYKKRFLLFKNVSIFRKC